jgi:hypothetical protein
MLTTVVQALFSISDAERLSAHYATIQRPTLKALLSAAPPDTVRRLQLVMICVAAFLAASAVFLKRSAGPAASQLLGLAVLFIPILAFSIRGSVDRVTSLLKRLNDETGSRPVATLLLPYAFALTVPPALVLLAQSASESVFLGPGFLMSTLLFAAIFTSLVLLAAVLTTSALILPAIAALSLLWLRAVVVQAVGKGLWRAFVWLLVPYAGVATVYYTLATTEVPAAVKPPWICSGVP